jgi:ferrochelatase
MRRIRILLAAHGEAEGSGVLENFWVSHTTLAHAAEVMRLPAPLRFAICAMAALRKRIGGGGGSPHNLNTQQQAEALQRLLASVDKRRQYRVEAIFASSPPYLEDEIVAPAGVDKQIVLSMIPSDSRLSCGLCCHPLAAVPVSSRGDTVVAARLWEDPEFIALQCAHVTTHFSQIASDQSSCLVLALHGTVTQDAQGAEPDFHTGAQEKGIYAEALRAALMAVPQRPWRRVEIAYLNHGVGGQWSSPALPELLARLAGEGVHSVVAYACEHLVDGSETARLPEILRRAGIAETRHLPSLNADAAFIEFLARRVDVAMDASEASMTCDPCPLRSAATPGAQP